MATENPRDRASAVSLTIPADQVRFLRETFEMARAGIRDELREHREQLDDPDHLRREDAIYGRLLKALYKHKIVPDADVLGVLADLATLIDAGNEYSRVVSEHEALHGLLAQLTGGR